MIKFKKVAYSVLLVLLTVIICFSVVVYIFLRKWDADIKDCSIKFNESKIIQSNLKNYKIDHGYYPVDLSVFKNIHEDYFEYMNNKESYSICYYAQNCYKPQNIKETGINCFGPSDDLKY